MVRFQVFTIDRGEGRTPQTVSPLTRAVGLRESGGDEAGTFATEAEASRFVSKFRKEFAGRDTTVGIREVPTAVEKAKFQRFEGRQVTGPPPKERGIELQQRRQQLEKIQKKVKVKEGKIDLSKLTSREKSRVRQITGVVASQAFTVEKAKPTTKIEFIKSLETRQRITKISRKQARAAQLERIKTVSITAPRREAIPTPTKIEQLEERIQRQQIRQREFFTSPGFQRIEDVAGVLTRGARIRAGRITVLPTEERGFAGKTAQTFVAGLLGFPIALGGAVALAGEKISITREALTTPGIERRRITEEFFIGAPKRVVTEFKAAPPEEKAATALFVLTAPFLGGGPVRRFVGKRVTRAKAIEELTPVERGKLERFELSIEELKGVRTEPKKLNLQEVERLSPEAAKALEKVILKNKENVVVGGSVAQRTQIKGPSRVPEDIDIFTTRRPSQLVNEIATELRQAGVERVSTVKGKQVTIEGKKAIEVKELSLLEANIKKVQTPLQRVSSAFIKTPRGVKVLRLGAQAQRKVVGGFGLERERRRLKDIQDLPTILRSLRQTQKGKTKVITRELTPEQLAKRLIKAGKLKEVKIVEPSKLKDPKTGSSRVGDISLFKKVPTIRIAKDVPRTRVGGAIVFLKQLEVKALVSSVRKEGIKPVARRIGLGIRESDVRSNVLKHELLHLRFPNKSEAQILKLEAKTKTFKVKEVGGITILSSKQLRKSKAGSLFIRPRREIGPPSVLKPISLRKEPPSLGITRRGEPSGLGGLPSQVPSILGELGLLPSFIGSGVPSRITPVSALPPAITTPSLLRPTPPERPSVLRPSEGQQLSLLGPTRPTEPSILQPTDKAVPSLLEPLREQPTPTRRKPPGLPSRKIRRVRRPGFDTFIRRGEKRGDKFVKAFKNLPENRAILAGARAVDNFIEASFIIKRSGKTTTRPDVPRPTRLLQDKFRGIKPGSKLPGRTIVEKRGKRLDRGSEVLQISFFKQQALKNQILGQVQRRPINNGVRVRRFL